uniref:Uncharacterized protein n=1 Tax=Tanacetum cinerariifolium TaxID=118510 RepID=A0A6L2LRY9_TANCI|nr:hypothetical protein [Tanacetum cinerariifolium]
MVNVIPPNHVNDVPVVEPDQHDDVPVVLEHVLVNEDEDPEEEEFEEEKTNKSREIFIGLEFELMIVGIKRLYDDLRVTADQVYDVIEAENPIEHEDETVPASIHEVGESSAAPFLCEDNDGLFPSLMRMDINSLFGRMSSLSRRLCGSETVHALGGKKGKAKDELYGKLILDLGNKVHSSVVQGMNVMEKLVENLRNAKDKVECKKLKNKLEEARGFMFEERPNEAINVSIEDEKSPSSEP